MSKKILTNDNKLNSVTYSFTWELNQENPFIKENPGTMEDIFSEVCLDNNYKMLACNIGSKGINVQAEIGSKVSGQAAYEILKSRTINYIQANFKDFVKESGVRLWAKNGFKNIVTLQPVEPGLMKKYIQDAIG